MGQSVTVQIILSAKNLANSAIAAVENQVTRLKSAVTSLQGQLASLGLSIGLGEVVKYLVQVNSETQTLITRLTTLTGSATTARAAFAQFAKLSEVTPFKANDWVEAYLILKNQGIDPTMQSMKAFGDLSAAYGENITTLAESIRGATVGNLRAMRNFGIGLQADGDKIVATFRGQRTEIGRDAQSIVGYLEHIAETKYAGTMDREAQTLGGSLSRLKSAADNLARAIGDAGLARDLSDAAHAMQGFVDSASGVAKLSLEYHAFTGVIGTLIDALGLVGRALVTPFEMAYDLIAGILHGIVGLVSGALTPVAATIDALSGGKTTLAKSLAGFSGSQFKAAGGDLKAGVWDDGFKALGDAFGAMLANIALRNEEIQALAGKVAAAESNAEAGIAPPAGPAGVPAQGHTTASGANLALPGKDTSAEEAKRAQEQYVRDLEARADALRELIELNNNAADAANELAHVENQLAREARAGNVTLEQRVSLLRTLQESRTTRQGAGFLTVEELLDKQFEDTWKASRAQQIGDTLNIGGLRKQNARDALAFNQSADQYLADNSVGGHTDPRTGKMVGQTFVLPSESKFGAGIIAALKKMKAGFRDAVNAGTDFDTVLEHTAATTLNGFAAAFESAFEALGDGSKNAAKNFESTMLKAIGSVAEQYGELFLYRAIGDAADFNAVGAAEFGVASAGMFAIAGALDGEASRVSSWGSGGGAATASSANSTLAAAQSQGTATLVIEGGLLDMNDPRQADALANALGVLSGRNVIIKTSRG